MRAYADMQKAPHESQSAIDADLSFHRAVLSAAHNELLTQMAGVIGAGLLTSFRISSSLFDVFVPQHGEILEAIRYGRPNVRARRWTSSSSVHGIFSSASWQSLQQQPRNDHDVHDVPGEAIHERRLVRPT